MAKQWKRSLSGADVQEEAEDALEKDINNLSPASNSIAANLDGGVAAVDWSTKNLAITEISGNVKSENDSFPKTITLISGSGYITDVFIEIDDKDGQEAQAEFLIDGSVLTSDTVKNNNIITLLDYATLARFGSSVELRVSEVQLSIGVDYTVEVSAVLD